VIDIENRGGFPAEGMLDNRKEIGIIAACLK
jgi:hypothetical protein